MGLASAEVDRSSIWSRLDRKDYSEPISQQRGRYAVGLHLVHRSVADDYSDLSGRRLAKKRITLQVPRIGAYTDHCLHTLGRTVHDPLK